MQEPVTAWTAGNNSSFTLNSYWDKPTAARMNQYTTAIWYEEEDYTSHRDWEISILGPLNSTATAGIAMLTCSYYWQHCIMSRQPRTSAALSQEDLINPKPFLGLFKIFIYAHRKTGANKMCWHVTTSKQRNTRVLRLDAVLERRPLGWPLQESAENNQSPHGRNVLSERSTESK